jgi:hypothetical protein
LLTIGFLIFAQTLNAGAIISISTLEFCILQVGRFQTDILLDLEIEIKTIVHRIFTNTTSKKIPAPEGYRSEDFNSPTNQQWVIWQLI